MLVLVGTGMRIGGALTLECADLDLHADIPYVRGAARACRAPAATPPPDRCSSPGCTVNR